MIKRGVILIGIFLLIFSFYSYDVNSALEDCGSCESDADCNPDIQESRWTYACRIRDDCVEGGINNLRNVEYQCSSDVSRGEFGVHVTSMCSAIRNVNSCVYVGGYGEREVQDRCENIYSCNGNQLNINYKTFNENRDGCRDIGTYNVDCTNINERCSGMGGAYGESCSCRSNGITASCAEPTNFVRVRTSTSNCGDPIKLYDGYDGNMGLWCFDVQGRNCIEDNQHLNFFMNRGEPYDNVAGILYYKDNLGESWTCNQNNGYAILDLGREYRIYTIRLYGNDNIQFRLYSSSDQNNWNQINQGNIMNMGNINNRYSVLGYITGSNELVSDSYFLIKYNIDPQGNEIYLNSPVNARYIKYEVTQGVGNNFGNEIVIEGKPAGEQGAVCGNGRIEQGEECDGNSLNGRTCEYYGFNRGILRCNEPDVVRNRCRYDTSGCYYRTGNIDFDLRVSAGRVLRGVEGEELMCPGDSNDVRISLMNVDDERGSVNNVYINDYVYYDPNCDNIGYLYYSRAFNDCGSLSYGQSCIRTYNLNYAWYGCYYHNVYVYGRPA